ncbi:MAG: DUF2752 domain-containing protein [Holophagaceae bacterium]|nr:DUF2752 domain-containing protein [Holophagaceae bacterium]
MNSRGFPWLATGLVGSGGLGILAAKALGASRLSLPPCIFKSLTGVPCATCGLTRCGMALAQGDWRMAFHWHPLAVLFVLCAPVLVAWDLRRARRGEPFPDLPDSLALRMAAAGLFLGAWALQVARGI